MKSLLAVLLLCSVTVVADDQHHHESYDPSHLGSVNFPTTCAPSVQKDFERGVALLHSFWYEEAEKAFTAVGNRDPGCAMAYWGIAMSRWHELWDPPSAVDIAASRAALKKAAARPATSEREHGFLAAIDTFYRGAPNVSHDERARAYSNAMSRLHQQFQDDREITIFYALSLLASSPPSDLEKRKKAGALLQPIFAAQPNHPGVAHYLIHSYDSPQLAQLGLPAAREYARIAPSAPHALHMPSHIFSQLGLWQDSIASNLASIAATRQSAAMHMGGAGHQLHAMDFLQYAYLQTGQDKKAAELIADLKTLHDMPAGEMDYSRVAFTTRYDLELHRWKDAAVIPVPQTKHTPDEATARYARALGAAHLGNRETAQSEIARLKQIEAEFRGRSGMEAEHLYQAVFVARQIAEAWTKHAAGQDEQAIAEMRSAVATDEKSPNEAINIPAREILADLLLDMNRPQQALVEYQAALKLAPNRFNGLYGAARAAELAGKPEVANAYYASLLKMCDGAESDRPELQQARKLLASTH